MKTEVVEEYSIRLLRDSPDKIFVFGDNMKRYGKGGQAIIRDEHNSFGIATKRYPSKDNRAYFSDKPDELDTMMGDLRSLHKLARGSVVVFPAWGIGTGLAMLERKSPLIWNELCNILLDHFGFDNRARVCNEKS
jgi:hypothetical protein